MITLQWLYVLAGTMFAGFALLSAVDRTNRRRFGNAAFWGLMAVSLLAGDLIGSFANGLLVIALAGLAGFGLVGRGHPPTTGTEEREAFSLRLGNRLFLPALIIPATALFGTLLYNFTPLGELGLFEPKRETYVLLGVGVLLALVTIFVWLRPPAIAPLQEGRRLIDAIGWAAVLPQMLAALGVLFAAAGVGEVIGGMTKAVIPEGSIFLSVLAVRTRHGAFHDDHGQCFRRLSGNGRGDRRAATDPELRRRPGGGRRDRDAGGFLRHLADADGSQLQPGAGGAARAQGSIWGDQGAGCDGAAAARREHFADLFRGLPVTALDADMAARFARIALGHVRQEYPHKLDHVLAADADALPPRALHPIFFGSFDWHSCVHGWWTLLTLRRLFPDLPEADRISALADDSFTPDKVAAERAYLERPNSAGFERPYGWAWLLALHGEAARHPDLPWADHLAPLADAFAARFGPYLAKLTYPITVGTHFNTAFALTLALDWAGDHDPALATTISDYAESVFAGLQDYRGWEPGGDEFLSPALSVALLMSRVRGRAEFTGWWDAFLPDASLDRFEPATVSDRSDGKIAHLDGLNLSRAWAFRSIASTLGDHPAAPTLRSLADRHLAGSLPHVAGDYAGEHWLATFALLALLAAD